MSAPLTDAFGRAFSYLRLSLEDACDFRCRYCLPHGFAKEEAEPPLSADEVRRLVAAFAGMGFWKVRLTGGEPTLRRDLVRIVAETAAAPGVRRVSLSTNGWRLAGLAADLKAAGLHGLNVSVDSLDRARFREVTGQDKLPEVLAGIERALALGFASVKANAVLMKGLNDGELDRFLDWTKDAPLGVRFIELMPTADSIDFFARRHMTAETLLARLAERGWRELPRREGDGPARAFEHPRHLGTAGVIAPYAKDFCANCNRLRVTSRGRLRLCLFAEGEHSLRPLLQDDAQLPELQAAVRGLIGRKEVSHYLPEGRFGDMRKFSAVGG